jgi:hypothetical protein
MNRMGHSSTRAARIYLHTREEREQQLAATLDKMARRELKAAGAKRIARRSGHATRNPASRGVRPGSMNKASELWVRGMERVTGIERTRTISLEICPVPACYVADLCGGVSASDRERDPSLPRLMVRQWPGGSITWRADLPLFTGRTYPKLGRIVRASCAATGPVACRWLLLLLSSRPDLAAQ